MTGGIASGKTAVSDHFASLGVPIIDTDLIAREMVAPGSPALNEIAAAFGQDYLDSAGRLRREKMRRAIFTDPSRKTRLEAILHPRIAREAKRQVSSQSHEYCLLVIPLFSESGRYVWVDRVLLVDVAEALQIERVMVRDGIDREQAQAILNAQASREDRLQLADDVLDNSGSLEELRTQVEKLHQKYLALSARRPITP